MKLNKSVIPRFGVLVPVYLPAVPEHSAVDFVAGLHPGHIHPFALQSLQNLLRVHAYSLLELAQRHILPVKRSSLAAGVGEKVAVVEVHHQLESLCLCPFCLGDNVGLVTPGPVAELRRIHPYSEPDGAKPRLLHQGKQVPAFALGVIELPAGSFHLATPAHIGTFDKGLLLLDGRDYRVHRFRIASHKKAGRGYQCAH